MTIKLKVCQYEQSCTSVLSKRFNLRIAINTTIVVVFILSFFFLKILKGEQKSPGKAEERK